MILIVTDSESDGSSVGGLERHTGHCDLTPDSFFFMNSHTQVICLILCRFVFPPVVNAVCCISYPKFMIKASNMRGWED